MPDRNERRPPARESAEARRERLAAELRANLGKRKAQARARAAAADGADTAAPAAPPEPDERGTGA